MHLMVLIAMAEPILVPWQVTIWSVANGLLLQRLVIEQEVVQRRLPSFSRMMGPLTTRILPTPIMLVSPQLQAFSRAKSSPLSRRAWLQRTVLLLILVVVLVLPVVGNVGPVGDRVVTTMVSGSMNGLVFLIIGGGRIGDTTPVLEVVLVVTVLVVAVFVVEPVLVPPMLADPVDVKPVLAGTGLVVDPEPADSVMTYPEFADLMFADPVLTDPVLTTFVVPLFSVVLVIGVSIHLFSTTPLTAGMDVVELVRAVTTAGACVGGGPNRLHESWLITGFWGSLTAITEEAAGAVAALDWSDTILVVVVVVVVVVLAVALLPESEMLLLAEVGTLTIVLDQPPAVGSEACCKSSLENSGISTTNSPFSTDFLRVRLKPSAPTKYVTMFPSAVELSPQLSITLEVPLRLPFRVLQLTLMVALPV